MCHTYKNGSQLEKLVTIKNITHREQNVSRLEKCVTARKMCQC